MEWMPPLDAFHFLEKKQQPSFKLLYYSLNSRFGGPIGGVDGSIFPHAPKVSMKTFFSFCTVYFEMSMFTFGVSLLFVHTPSPRDVSLILNLCMSAF